MYGCSSVKEKIIISTCLFYSTTVKLASVKSWDPAYYEHNHIQVVLHFRESIYLISHAMYVEKSKAGSVALKMTNPTLGI